MKNSYKPAIDSLLEDPSPFIKGRRYGFLGHAASLTGAGEHAADVLAKCGDGRLGALMSPEHGFFSAGAAGEKIEDAFYPELGVPIHSLYGKHRKPSPAMLEELELIIFDLQDLGFRCYTYVSTLRYVMEACAEAGIALLVLDRPIPMPNYVDGPMLNPDLESFVGMIPAPMAYAMTPAETAQWLKKKLKLKLELEIIPMFDYSRLCGSQQEGSPWVPPSPGIKTWEASYAYLTTVFTEALPQFDCARHGKKPFQSICASFIHAEDLCTVMNSYGLEGVVFEGAQTTCKFNIIDASMYRPITASVYLLFSLTKLYGVDTVWKAEGVRSFFFDNLYGDAEVRFKLKDGLEPHLIIEEWENTTYKKERNKFLMYS